MIFILQTCFQWTHNKWDTRFQWFKQKKNGFIIPGIFRQKDNEQNVKESGGRKTGGGVIEQFITVGTYLC